MHAVCVTGMAVALSCTQDTWPQITRFAMQIASGCLMDRVDRVEKERDALTKQLVKAEMTVNALTANSTATTTTANAAAPNALLAAAGQKLIDANKLFRAQAVDMERESTRFRNELTMKVAKYAIMCKELSEENARGKEARGGLNEEVGRLEEERNRLAKELSVMNSTRGLSEPHAPEGKRERRAK